MNDIVWQDPPAPNRSGPKDGKTKRFVDELAERPGEWALYPETMSNVSGLGSYKKRFPEVEWTGRTRPDGRADIYARWVGEA